MTSDWLPLQAHYERCFARAGPTPQGVDWPDGHGLEARFATQLGVLAGYPSAAGRPELLDLGCGPGLLVDYLRATKQAEQIAYRGIDISQVMIDGARRRWPELEFEARDIISHPLPDKCVDVVVMNGLLTERQGIPRARMVDMAEAIVRAAFRTARHGIAFNAMSRHVDWERDDLFHWGFDEVAAFLTRDLTRHISFRSDYGLYEFTAFAWLKPQVSPFCSSPTWWER